jgi:hypothetical protein
MGEDIDYQLDGANCTVENVDASTVDSVIKAILRDSSRPSDQYNFRFENETGSTVRRELDDKSAPPRNAARKIFVVMQPKGGQLERMQQELAIAKATVISQRKRILDLEDTIEQNKLQKLQPTALRSQSTSEWKEAMKTDRTPWGWMTDNIMHRKAYREEGFDVIKAAFPHIPKAVLDGWKVKVRAKVDINSNTCIFKDIYQCPGNWDGTRACNPPATLQPYEHSSEAKRMSQWHWDHTVRYTVIKAAIEDCVSFPKHL